MEIIKSIVEIDGIQYESIVYKNNKEYFSCNSCDLKKQCNQNIDIHSHCMNHKLNTIFKKLNNE